MTDKKGWGSTVAGWFIEQEEPTGSAGSEAEGPDGLPDASAEASLSPKEDYATPSPTQGVFKTSPPPPTGGQVEV